MDIYAMSHFRDYLDLYQSKLSFPLLIPKGLNIPSPATGSSYIQTKRTTTENKFSSQPFYLNVIPKGFKPLTFRTGI